MTLADTASQPDLIKHWWAQATLAFDDKSTHMTLEPESMGANVARDSGSTTGGGVVIIGSRPAVEQYLARALVPIVALMEVGSTPSPQTRQRFHDLAERWRKESGHLSSLEKRAMLPSYQQIIGLGPQAVPLLIERLREEPGHWFWALRAITGVNPVSPEHVGRVKDMADDWIRWAKDNGMTA